MDAWRCGRGADADASAAATDGRPSGLRLGLRIPASGSGVTNSRLPSFWGDEPAAGAIGVAELTLPSRG